MSQPAVKPGASLARPLFSVVLPTYQRAYVVGEAIASVLSQTLGDFELIVADDGSTDGTAAVVSSLRDERVRFVPLEHGGRSQTRNEGVARAHGDVVIFLDSDDRAVPNWLEEMYRPFADPSVACVCCGAHIVTDRPEVRIHAEEILQPERLDAVCSDKIGLFLAGTFAVRRSIFEAVGGYDPQLAFGENSELAIRLIQYCEARELRVAAVHKPLVQVRNRRTFGSVTEFHERLESAELFLDRHGDCYRQKSAAAYAHQRAVGGVNAYRLGLTGRAIRHFVLAVAADPGKPVHWARLAIGLIPPLARRYWMRQKNNLASI